MDRLTGYYWSSTWGATVTEASSEDKAWVLGMSWGFMQLASLTEADGHVLPVRGP